MSVAFRRIRGRVIPIKLDPEHEKMLQKASKNRVDIAKGAGLVAAGVGTSFAAGNLYKKTIFKAIRTSIGAFESAGIKSDIMKDFAKAKNLNNLASKVRTIAPIVGAGLIAAGAYKIAKGLGKEKTVNPELKAGIIGGTIGTSALFAPKLRHLTGEAFRYGMHGSAGAKEGVKAAFGAFAKALKSNL